LPRLWPPSWPADEEGPALIDGEVPTLCIEDEIETALDSIDEREAGRFSVGLPLPADVDEEEANTPNAAFPPSDSDGEEEAGLVDVRLASLEEEEDDDSTGLSASSYSFQLQFIRDKEESVSGTASSIRALTEHGTSSWKTVFSSGILEARLAKKKKKLSP
jgi:hypothetical protein